MNPSCFADLQPGETPRARLVRWVRRLAGASLSSRLDELTGLVGRGVDDPYWAAQVVQWQTNCATSALGFMSACCGSVEAARERHALLATRSVNGMSMPWIMQIGYELGALVKPGARRPRAGDLMHYGTPGANNDHVEWCLSDPVDDVADHGGGGRDHNAITVGNGSIETSLGRPLLTFFDLDKLDLPTVDGMAAT